MIHLLGSAVAAAADPGLITYIMVICAVALALGFEFVNGFHDTANAVATVIYTHTLKPTPAVVWSGLWNLIGVLTSSGAVAFGVVALLPAELVLNIGSVAGFAMVFSLLASAIVWNVGTWYLGLPASSSHTLIGAIIGVGLANALLGPSHSITDGVNWTKLEEVGLGLLLSPLLGFVAAALLLLLAKWQIRSAALYRAPVDQKPPPTGVRALLLLTCTGVSFAHGSNDGQKGMGLIVLILIGILPGSYALNRGAAPVAIAEVASATATLATALQVKAAGATTTEEEAHQVLAAYIKPAGQARPEVFAALSRVCTSLQQRLVSKARFDSLSAQERSEVRTDLYLAGKALRKLEQRGALAGISHAQEAHATFAAQAPQLTSYIPDWVKLAVALALGLGTMIGYGRIVRTVGERIGKEHLTYAQGAAAELVAMGTILAADRLGLPISTTHVLSSGIAGTMAANHSGLQRQTVRNILLAWVLTLPVCILLGALLFAGTLNAITLMGVR